jgi:hypothetical protein
VAVQVHHRDLAGSAGRPITLCVLRVAGPGEGDVVHLQRVVDQTDERLAALLGRLLGGVEGEPAHLGRTANRVRGQGLQLVAQDQQLSVERRSLSVRGGSVLAFLPVAAFESSLALLLCLDSVAYL